jgi:hypothetical protein
MGKMPTPDQKQWKVGRPLWLREVIEVAFNKLLKQIWRDDLNMAVAEPAGWEPNSSMTEKTAPYPRKAGSR